MSGEKGKKNSFAVKKNITYIITIRCLYAGTVRSLRCRLRTAVGFGIGPGTEEEGRQRAYTSRARGPRLRVPPVGAARRRGAPLRGEDGLGRRACFAGPEPRRGRAAVVKYSNGMSSRYQLVPNHGDIHGIY